MKKVFFLATTTLLSISSFAQDSLKTLNEVVVTANRFPNKSTQTGKVVTVISREQIAQAGSKDLSQVITELGGVYVNGSYSNPGKDRSVYLRGAKVDHTLITIDGVPVYDPSGIGSNFDLRWLSIDNVERIEILKGSQSTLYGSDAIAGVINIITRKTIQHQSFNGGVHYGSYGTVHANAGWGGHYKKTDYAISYSWLRTKGIDETTDTTENATFRDRDGYTQHNVYGRLTYRPSEKITISPFVRYAAFLQQYDQGSFIDELDLTANSKNFQTGIKSELKIGKGSLMINYNFNRISRTYVDDSVKSRNGYDTYNKGNYMGAEHFADAFMMYPVHPQVKITGGAEFRSSSASQEYVSIGLYPYNSQYGSDSVRQHQTSVYASMLYNTSNGINIEAGGRWNRHSVYGSNFVYNINPSFRAGKHLKLFANLSTAYKTPSLYQLYSEYGNKTLKPEIGMTLEGGLEWRGKDDAFMLRATAFNRKVKDLIIFYYNPFTWSSNYINQDRQHDYGAELEMKTGIGKTGNLVFNMSYVDGKVSTLKDGKDTSYFNLIRRPKFSGGLSISNQFGKNLLLSMSVQALGERTDLSFDANFNQIEVKLKSYALLNLYAEYSFSKKKIKAFADIRNITNTQYTEVYGFNTMGFNAYGGLRFAF